MGGEQAGFFYASVYLHLALYSTAFLWPCSTVSPFGAPIEVCIFHVLCANSGGVGSG